MSEEPSLPRLPANERARGFAPKSLKRGRAWPKHPSSNFNSSDPAIFSSDDDPGLDNYVEGRHKKRYVGSWFQQQPTSSDSTFAEVRVIGPKPKRTLARQVDSGVFLGSDGAESDVMEVETPTHSKLPQLNQRPPVPVQTSGAELKLQSTIRECIDKGKESIDGWSLGLEGISDETIVLLSQVAPIPQITKDVAFEAWEPQIRLILAKNLLTRVPGALFDVSHLTVLSLRGNELTELPPAISKLQNLVELNVSQNQLRHLPAELLDLTNLKLRTLSLSPNPFVQPATKLMRDGHSKYGIMVSPLEGAINFPSFADRYLGRSPLQVSTSNGRVTSDFFIDPNGETLPVEESAEADISQEDGTSASSTSIGNLNVQPSSVPSLLETALRSCYNSSELPYLASYLPEELSHLEDLLERAVEQKRSGGLTCSRCRRMMVVPTLEWIEWRLVCNLEHQWTAPQPPNNRFMHAVSLIIGEVDEAVPVPLLRRACSWRCGPDRVPKTVWEVRNGELVLVV